MKKRQARELSGEERMLWNQVARTTTPLKGRAVEPPEAPVGQDADQADDAVMRSAADKTVVGAGSKKASASAAVPATLDRTTRNKIAKGRLVIGATVDLHGLTQSEAHELLLSFLARASAADIRQVLVITGKGSMNGGDGILRKAVPSWLATAPFRPLVSAFDHAARQHGGSGALYVRLRRPREKRGKPA